MAMLKPQGYYRHSALLLLLLAYVLSFVDRNIMAVLVGPIQADLGISDFRFSLLHGAAFAVFYTVMGLPIARWADRGNRVRIIALGVAFWSLMTVLCGFARQYTSLFLARMGVGLGEAALSPPAHSLLSDYYSREQLPMALAIYTLGITLGGGLAYSLGAWVYAALDGQVFAWMGMSWQPWQLTFVIIGAPGLILALLLALLREPVRRGRQVASETVLPLRDTLLFLRRHAGLYGFGFAGIALLSILGYGVLTWLVAFLQRSYGMPLEEAGARFGPIYMLAGSAGVLMGGFYATWLQKRHADAGLRTVVHVAWLALPPAVLAFLMPSADSSLVMLAVLVFLLNAYFGVSIAAFQTVTPNELRAQVSALFLFVTNLAGLALGPALVAALTDFVFQNAADLRYALALTGAVLTPLAALLVTASLKEYRRMLADLPGDAHAG